MDFRLSPEQEEFRRTVARFVDAEVAPVAQAIDEAGEFPRALFRRLGREGRLRAQASGDQFDRPNFAPAMGETALLAGYRKLLATLYSEEGYFRRCVLHLETAPARPTALRQGCLAALVRAVFWLGIVGGRRRWFWRLVLLGLRRGGISGLAKGVTLAVLGEHLVRYTHEEVLPRLDRRLAELRQHAQAGAGLGRTAAASW